ncbi:hypothetical protein ABB07_00330 [Streptomyces incarnatus]|uniref:Uncharacterized protein n=1 Tax=Streptomyces incarnatus TaxID=665007 RepID=A0ABN4GDU6_9ACTN|nr:hypothetical protein ABB07_00330 [Streptomyces incarnatus]
MRDSLKARSAVRSIASRGSGLRLLVVVLGINGRGREQLLGHRRLLVCDDVVRPAPRGGDGGVQPLAEHRAGEDGPLVLQRDAGDLPLPRLQVREPGRGRCARVGRGLPVRFREGGRRAAGGLEVDQGPAGGVGAVGGQQATQRLRLADVHAVRGHGGVHDSLVQARLAAAAAQDESQVTAGFSASRCRRWNRPP